MTKRFAVEKFTELEYGIKQDGETLIGLSLDKITAKYIVEQWNDLADVNEQLKSFNQDLSENLSVCADKRLAQGEHLTKLNNENEQLKTTIQQLRTDNTKQKKLLNTTMKENEHIKQTIKDMINTERTELGKMTLRHLWRQIQ